MAYANRTDLVTYGLPASALGNLTTAQQDAALAEASQYIDSRWSGRYGTPAPGQPVLSTYGTDVTQAVCKIAAYNLLSVRGYNPASGADVNIRMRHDDACKWVGEVQRQAATPIGLVPNAAPSPARKQPRVLSSSVINADGRTAPNRGW